MRTSFLILTTLGVLAFGLRPAVAQINVPESEPIIQGEPVTLTLDAPADTLHVTYRPNSRIEVTEAVPVGGAQTVAWTPKQAGVVQLEVDGGSTRTVSVRFQGTPSSGVLVLLLAGLILFGGALFSFYVLFREGPVQEEPPLTV